MTSSSSGLPPRLRRGRRAPASARAPAPAPARSSAASSPFLSSRQRRFAGPAWPFLEAIASQRTPAARSSLLDRGRAHPADLPSRLAAARCSRRYAWRASADARRATRIAAKASARRIRAGPV